MKLAVAVAKARGGEDAAPGFADGRGADEPGGILRRKAEEDLFYELVRQERRRRGFAWGIGEWRSAELSRLGSASLSSAPASSCAERLCIASRLEMNCRLFITRWSISRAINSALATERRAESRRARRERLGDDEPVRTRTDSRRSFLRSYADPSRFGAAERNCV